ATITLASALLMRTLTTWLDLGEQDQPICRNRTRRRAPGHRASRGDALGRLAQDDRPEDKMGGLEMSLFTKSLAALAVGLALGTGAYAAEITARLGHLDPTTTAKHIGLLKAAE